MLKGSLLKTILAVIAGVGVLVAGVAAAQLIVVVRDGGPPSVAAPLPTVTPLSAVGDALDYAPDTAIERGAPVLPSRTPTPTATITPTAVPLPTETPQPTATPLPSATPDVSPTPRNTPPPIVWTDAEKNALTWLCHGEIGGMGATRDDACLSVISTVRARYAYPNGFAETDVIGTLLRPGQFNVTIVTDSPHPDDSYMALVEAYAAGARGSCSGYLYFNSSPSDPAECTIFGAAGQRMNFFNNW